MAEAITDGGFENDSPLHEFGNGGSRSAANPYAGSWGAYLPKTNPYLTGGWWRQEIATPVGATVTVSCRIDGTLSGGSEIIAQYDSLDDNWQEIARTTSAAGYVLWEPGSFVATATAHRVRLVNNSNINGQAWFVDDVSADVVTSEDAVALGKYRAFQEVVNVLETITGTAAGYYTDLGGRVYTRWFDPPERPQVAMPYVCVPLVNEGETEETEGLGVTSRWTLRLHAYFSEDQQDDSLNSPAVQRAAEFRDDVLKAFLADQTLSNEVINCEVVSVDSEAGIYGDYAAVVVELALMQRVASDDLGPGA